MFMYVFARERIALSDMQMLRNLYCLLLETPFFTDVEIYSLSGKKCEHVTGTRRA